MYKWLVILSVIILSALCGLGWLGYHSIQIRAKGLEGARLGEFAEVAEQIRQDVKRKLDQFIQTEQNRPYTHYQYYHVPDSVVPGQQPMPVLRSPLGGRLDNGLAYGNFQIEPDGNITTPNDDIGQDPQAAVINNELYTEALRNRMNIKNNLLPALSGAIPGSFKLKIDERAEVSLNIPTRGIKETDLPKGESFQKTAEKGREFLGEGAKALPIESFKRQDQKAQVIRQRRSVVTSNVAQSTELGRGQAASDRPISQSGSEIAAQPNKPVQMREEELQTYNYRLPGARDSVRTEPAQAQSARMQVTEDMYDMEQPAVEESQAETVEIRIEPFVPVVVGGQDAEQSIFAGQVFLLRHVQIEDKHFLQGFQLNEKKLIEEVEESASRFMREGMSFELPQTKSEHVEDEIVAYTAIFDFGFGDLILNLKEIDPAWIGKQINQLRNWYFGIIAIVLLAVMLGLVSLWRNARAQLKLAQKKDDFISAVSHELRTPLTSIRMYSEMLEKNWVKSEDKLAEYYKNMRQESERLSRLIENVLDFSRIQRGRKKYAFNIGDVNKCVADVIEMMRPYAEQRGFTIKTELGRLEQTAFDSDAVTQIVVNLLDNGIKYAHNAEDKTLTVRTRSDNGFILIEVEDHGPGVPLRLRKKIFEEFYRSGAEATRETTGTGLGLALVKKFAQAHNGFVEILNAKPTGAIFRVALAARM